MKKMKQVLLLMTCVFVLLGTAACSSRDNADNGADQSSESGNDRTENNDVNMLILQFFDQYADEVRRHMEYENRYVFSYVEAILGNSEPTSSFSMTTFASRHKQLDGHHIEAKLTELKNIIIKYYPAKAYNNLLNSVLFDIFSCEKELAMHCLLEDFLLVPAVLRFEKENRR